jgi:phenylpyruvate tautomerase PptA (4-oxalocrotonate tautomerase family)
MDASDAHEPSVRASSARLRMAHLHGVVAGPRPGRMRDRRGRGNRGPLALPGPLSPQSVPAHLNPREEFDALVGAIVAAMAKHFDAEPDRVDVVTEEVPLLPIGWTDPVPTNALVRGPDAARVVLYRLPLTKRCRTRLEVEDATWQAILDRLAEVWELSPDDIDPRR